MRGSEGAPIRPAPGHGGVEPGWRTGGGGKAFLTGFLFFFASCQVLGSMGYVLLSLLVPDGVVFGALYRMPVYHWLHPHQYIALVAVSFGLCGSVWSVALGHLRGVGRGVSIVAVMALSIGLASGPGGLLWCFHDIQEGFVPPPDQLRRNLASAAVDGLQVGFLIMALSVPYNILGIIVGYRVLDRGQRFLAETGANRP